MEERFDLARPEIGIAASTRAEKAERDSEGRRVGNDGVGTGGFWAPVLVSAFRFRFLEIGAPSSRPLGGFWPVAW